MDDCLQRYFYFYGSDQRIASCISEIGVPFTEERGFHQVRLLLCTCPLSNWLMFIHVSNRFELEFWSPTNSKGFY